MKFSTTVEPQTKEPSKELNAQECVRFPAGLVGFPEFNEAEILYKPQELPFMWLKGTGKETLSFLVVEPTGLVPGYEIDVSDQDVEALNLKSADEALVLTVATLHKKQGETQPNCITLNLIGPVLVNRRTLQARQVIISNSHKYSDRHVLFETKESNSHTQTKEG